MDLVCKLKVNLMFICLIVYIRINYYWKLCKLWVCRIIYMWYLLEWVVWDCVIIDDVVNNVRECIYFFIYYWFVFCFECI